MVKWLVTLLGVLALWTPLAAADLSGRWTLALHPDFGGVDDTIPCTLREDGTALTLDCGGPPMTGSLDGQTVTLKITTGTKNEIPVTFIGTLDGAGTTITGTWHFVVSGEERSGDFTARKA